MVFMKREVFFRFPYYVLILSIYPILAVYALNIEQINGILIVRSLIISVLLFIILLGLARLSRVYRRKVSGST